MLPEKIEVSFADLVKVLEEGSGKLASNAYVRLVDQTLAIRMRHGMEEAARDNRAVEVIVEAMSSGSLRFTVEDRAKIAVQRLRDTGWSQMESD